MQKYCEQDDDKGDCECKVVTKCGRRLGQKEDEGRVVFLITNSRLINKSNKSFSAEADANSQTTSPDGLNKT